MMRTTIRFLLGPTVHQIGRHNPGQSVLDWLRTQAHLTGTKEGCNEGDCGACTVVIASAQSGSLVYHAINACIAPMVSLDGCQLLSVEHLRRADGALHPVQQAMVDQHGSQCGFCTPGFVMSLFALAKAGAGDVPDSAIDDALAGNLCRCTGYAPIVRAARAILAAPVADQFDATVTLARLEAMRDLETIVLSDGTCRLIAPATIDDLARILLEEPQATIIAGNSDVGLWVNKEMRHLNPIVWIGRVESLQAITQTDSGLEIGACVTFARALAPLSALHPDFGELIRRIAGVQIRNTGTIGGNIANGSPIGDMAPALIAAGATLHLRRGTLMRAMPLEAFFLAYGRQDRGAGEFIERISVPNPAKGTKFRVYKVSKRYDQDVSAVLGAFSLRLEAGYIVEARVAYGGMAATPKRALAVEAALSGQFWTMATLRQAQAAIVRDFTPLSDLRASASYRMNLARNLLERLFLETSGFDAQQTRIVGDKRLDHV